MTGHLSQGHRKFFCLQVILFRAVSGIGLPCQPAVTFARECWSRLFLGGRQIVLDGSKAASIPFQSLKYLHDHLKAGLL